MAQGADDPVGDTIAQEAACTLAAKATQAWPRMAMLAILAGMFIAFGSVASLIVQAAAGDAGPVRELPYCLAAMALLIEAGQMTAPD